MLADYLTHLVSSGAEIEEGIASRFASDGGSGEPRLAIEQTVLCPIAERGVLAVDGADAERFLHAQLTTDVATLARGRSSLTAYCTPQGRTIAIARIVGQDDRFLLSTPSSILGRLAERLTYYRLRAQVTFRDLSEEIVHIGVAGERTQEALEAAALPLPGDVDAVEVGGDLIVARVRGSTPRVEVFVPIERAVATWDALASVAKPVGVPAWRLLDVRAGVGWIVEATAEAFVPQMLNLHAIGGVSFTKGCFPGQEIVARLRYRGELKRRMYRLQTAGGPLPRPGDSITNAAAIAVGKVVTAAASVDDAHESLAVVQIAAAETDGDLRFTGGTQARVLALPYEVATAREKA